MQQRRSITMCPSDLGLADTASQIALGRRSAFHISRRQTGREGYSGIRHIADFHTSEDLAGLPPKQRSAGCLSDSIASFGKPGRAASATFRASARSAWYAVPCSRSRSRPVRPSLRASNHELARFGVERHRADSTPGFPDRIELRDLAVGETALLLNHEHQPASTLGWMAPSASSAMVRCHS